MPSSPAYDLVKDDQDLRTPLHAEQAFFHGITFQAKVRVPGASFLCCIIILYRRLQTYKYGIRVGRRHTGASPQCRHKTHQPESTCNTHRTCKTKTPHPLSSPRAPFCQTGIMLSKTGSCWPAKRATRIFFSCSHSETIAVDVAALSVRRLHSPKKSRCMRPIELTRTRAF